MNTKNDNKSKQAGTSDNKNTPKASETKSKSNAQSGKEASGEKNESAPAGKQTFVNLPKGGGAISGMGEKFQANPVTGTGSLSVPLTISAGRGEFTPQLALGYDSGSGNGLFGLGWSVGIPSISRKTDKGLPEYLDLENHESDTFILSGAEDLVPILKEENGAWKHDTRTEVVGTTSYNVFPYRPRTEGLFAVVERWYDTQYGISHWRSISKENISSVYGLSSATRIANPTHPKQIFTWLIEKSWDSKGNLIEFEYKQEDALQVPRSVYESQRLQTAECFTNQYLKQVKYGNSEMYSPIYPAIPEYTNGWHFHLVFDYGDHLTNNTQITPNQDWACRQDPFSTYKAGFEIRTYRLCQRVLMFHQFDELGENPVLVKSTDFSYEEHKHLTLLNSVTHCGHDGTETETLPSLEFTYSQAELGTKMHEVKPEYLDNIPSGVDGQTSQWADLYSEGINGILKQDNKAWYFIPNQGDKSYYDTNPDSRAELVLGGIRCELLKPAAMNTRQSSYHLADVDSDGLPELVINAPGMKGFYARDEKSQWQAFRPFSEMPNLNLGDSSVKIVDLSGEGMGDILIGKGDYFEIYLSEGKKGYGNFRRIRCNTTEAKGPRAIFSDELKQVYLADMSGDGLSDIVRIQNGSVCYWPNMGYGRFGERVMMANPPHYERPDQFNPSQIRLADVDGTGTTDIIYFGSTAAQYWKNQAGNSWSDALEIKNFPLVDPMSNAEVVDLFGNGTSCLVWSSKRPSQSRKMRYLELTNGIKPYLMIQTDNGMGGITKLQYTTSTKFYLRDKMSGKPWITRLPFPVHVLESVENRDEVSGSVFVNRYAYHHGYYDNDEREFRGFGMVEQWDTELYNMLIDQSASVPMEDIVPPVYVKTWFHTGFFKNRIEISKQFADEYFDGDAQAWLLPDTILPSGLKAIEAREACRALRGSALRKEVYAQDGTAQELIPYTVEEKNYDIKKLQGIHSNKHGVFHITERETLAYQYERNTDDPRILQSLVLETDEYGNVKKSAQVAYPRRANAEALAEQLQMHIVYTENSFINKSEIGEIHLIGVGCETKGYEVTGISNYNHKFEKEALKTAVTNPDLITEIAFTATPGTTPEKRKIQHQRIYFWNETLTEALPLEEITPQALPYQQQNLELTQDIIDEFNSESTKLTTTMLQNEGKYLQDGNNWWIVSEKQIFDASSFYLPVSVIDPFGNESSLMYDEYYLMIEQITDALLFETDVFNDYRVMQAWKITDPNGNSQSVAFDALGMVKALAVSGKNSGEGDNLNDPTIKYEYDLHNWRDNQKPVYSHVESRETHGDPNSRWLESYTYSGGLGQEVQTKVQAEDGLAWTIVGGEPEQVESTDRWTSTGRTILNNKGKAVKQYEPWFSTTHEYEPESELTEYGVTPILHYDPLSRNIKTDMPDGTFTKVEFTPWEQKSYDQNDNVLASQWYADRSPSSSASAEEKRAAQITLEHNNTPQTVYFDSLGRAFITEDDNGTFGKYRVKNKLDISGRPLQVTDAKERIMTWHFYGFTQALTTRNIDSGERWTINDVKGKPIRAWDERGHAYRNTYDVLQRPLEMFVTENSIEKLVQKQEYGISAVLNNIGQVENIYTQDGKTNIQSYDFKNNVLSLKKQFAVNYTNVLDWSQTVNLQTEEFITQTSYDALNRPITITQPDNTVVSHIYNKGGLLEQVLHGTVTYISNINYNEKGQREDVYYGNNTKTRYYYDAKTFRLKRLLTTRNNGTDILQDINYTFDAVGNIVQQKDNAQQIFYFDNQVIAPNSTYTYDPLYRLINATGRELSSLASPTNEDFANNIGVPNPAANAMQNYNHTYVFDELGNMQSDNWKDYVYDIATNRLLKHDPDQTLDDYTYDNHGNMLTMPHLTSMVWDYADRLQSSGNGTFTSYYNYDMGGNRSRKVVIKSNIREERYYVGDYEIYRKFVNDVLDTERSTVHIIDDRDRFAMIETETGNTPVVRYQYNNHLGSACLELDSTAAIISYEEYHPYGTTSYRSGRTETEGSHKRYKYVGKERDEETGLYYYGARYYAAWICRFVSVDALQFKYPYYTPYQYAGNKPISYIDLDGLEPLPKGSAGIMTRKEIVDLYTKRMTLNKDNTNVINQNAQNFKMFQQNALTNSIKRAKVQQSVNIMQYNTNRIIAENKTQNQSQNKNQSENNNGDVAFNALNQTFSYSSTAISITQVVTRQLNNNWVMGSNGMWFLKTADPTLKNSLKLTLEANSIVELKGLNKSFSMSDKLNTLSNSRTLKWTGIVVNGISSTFVALNAYDPNKSNGWEVVGIGAVNFGLNYFALPSVIYSFYGAVTDTDQFKNQQLAFWDSEMTKYHNTDSKAYDNAKLNYQKYADMLGIKPQSKQTFIGPSNH